MPWTLFVIQFPFWITIMYSPREYYRIICVHTKMMFDSYKDTLQCIIDYKRRVLAIYLSFYLYLSDFQVIFDS